jgi:hypothetical protein
VIHLYAVTDRPGAALPEGPMRDGPLREATANELAVVFTPREDPVADPSPEALWAHEEVVEALMRDRAVLPMRFGTCLATEDAAVALLEGRGAEFARLLEGVRGRVELSVRVMDGGGESPPRPSSGSEYLMQRLGARDDARQIEQAVHAPLARMAERSTSNLAPARGGVLTGSYLLDEDGVASFTEQVRRLQETNPSLTLTCTGPWPPYSFVGEAQT